MRVVEFARRASAKRAARQFSFRVPSCDFADRMASIDYERSTNLHELSRKSTNVH